MFCTTQQLHYSFADVAVGLLSSESQEVDGSYFIIKRGFFVVYIYKKRGLSVLGAYSRKKETLQYV